MDQRNFYFFGLFFAQNSTLLKCILYICIITIFNNNKNQQIMTSQNLILELENEFDWTVLRIDILADGASFEGVQQDCALILEDEHGQVNMIQFVTLDEVCDYMNFAEIDDCIKWLKEASTNSDEAGIDFSVSDAEILGHIEHFRTTSHNTNYVYKTI